MRKVQIILLIEIVFSLSSCETISLLLQGQKPAKLEIKDNTIYLKGVLGKTVYHRLKRLLNKHNEIDTLVFIQSDGSEDDDYNLKTARLIQDNQIVTKLLSTSDIASGAVDLFLADRKRIIPEGAKLGIHSWRSGQKEGKDFPKDDQNHKMFLDYYQSIGIDTNFYWHTLYVAPANDIHWMTEEEILKFNIRKE